MTKYIKGDVFPYTHQNLMEDNPNTSFPHEPLSVERVRSEFGVQEVEEVDRPRKDGYHVIHGSPVMKNGKLVEVWDTVLKTREEINANDIQGTFTEIRPGFKAVEGEPEVVDGQWVATWNYVEETDWLVNRRNAYGNGYDQLEYITENGLEAWQEKVAIIKETYPKT